MPREGNDSIKATRGTAAIRNIFRPSLARTLESFVIMIVWHTAQRIRTPSTTSANRSRRASKKMGAEEP